MYHAGKMGLGQGSRMCLKKVGQGVRKTARIVARKAKY